MVARSKGTQKTWPDETPDQLLECIRQEYGDETARIVAASIDGPVPSGGGRTAFRLYAGDKRSRRFGVLPYRGKSAHWSAS